MNISQDQFRNALREVAEDITPSCVPPLAMPDRSLRQGQRARIGGRARQRWLRLLAPVAAAAAVIAVIAVVVAVGGARSPGRAPAGTAGLRSAPGYYMALLPTSTASNALLLPYAVVRNTATGATVATVTPPKPFSRFTLIAGGADDRTFILAAQEGPSDDRNKNAPAKLYRARFNPADDLVSLTPLPIPEFGTATWLSGLALAPNGTSLAVVLLQPQLPSGNVYTQVRVYSLTGKSRAGHPVKVWQGYGSINNLAFLGYHAPCISWGSDGVLAFNWGGNHPYADNGIWLLNTRSASGSLIADSRHVVVHNVPGGLQANDDGILTASGKVIVDPVSVGRVYFKGCPISDLLCHYAVVSEFREFSAATGKEIRVFWPTRSLGAWVEWSSPSGSVLVVAAAVGSGAKSSGRAVFGVLSGRSFVPIPDAPAAIYPGIALLAF
jgi:hypothetical protein